MRIKREKEKALTKVGVPTHQSKDAPSVGKLGRVTSLRIFPRRPQPPTISFDYSVSTLTRTFRIGKKKNKIISARSSMRERESCASSLRIGFRDGLDEIEKPLPLLPSQCALENYEFMKKTSALIKVSLWFFSFFSFVPAYTSECTLCRALDHHPSTTKTFWPSDRCFPFYSSICMKIIVQTMSRWKET